MGNLFDDIIELERVNMTPILEELGFTFDSEKLRENLSKDQEIVTIYKEDVLLGCIRYTYIPDLPHAVKVLSIQINNPKKNRFVLVSLKKKFLKDLNSKDIKKVITIVQKSNLDSIHFHEKLGFKVSREFEKAIEYSAELSELNRKYFK